MDMREWIGPQSQGDSTIERRHRFHQSWYRGVVLGLPAGTGPRESDTSRYGNMLTAEAANAGSNFLTGEIHQVAEARIAAGGTVEPFRCRRNMLSSQPMCFNLFGPLTSRPELAALFVRNVTGRDVEIDDDGVRIEDSPGHLADRTGLDASIRYRTADGRRGVLGVEAKLSERFSPTVYELDSKPAYRRYSEASGSPFDVDQLEALTVSRFNQLWRNQLLCEAIRSHEDRDLADQVVVFPADAGRTGSLVDEYASLLAVPDAVRARTLSEVVEGLTTVAADDDQSWLRSFRTRYIDLELSSSLLDAWTAARPPFQ